MHLASLGGSWEDMEISPALSVKEADSHVRRVVEEMETFRKDFQEVVDSGNNDLKSFWLRKSCKPVLAVLLARDRDGKLALYRGTNMEVSMPTGSLCAERNVIGTALASNVGLKREDLKCVAVLAVNLHREEELGEGEESVLNEFELSPPAICQMTNEELEDVQNGRSMNSSGHSSGSSSCGSSGGNSNSAPASPVRKISLKAYDTARKNSAQKLGAGIKRGGTISHVVNTGDMNPLKPCGSCNEWLKKIAEPNPEFQVITFTDEGCKGIYLNSVT